MHLLGLTASQLLPIFAVAGALVVGLYILRLRRRPVPVPFSPLWAKVLRDKDATSLFSKLRRLFSLLLQLAILGLLVFALGDPRTAVEVIKGRNLVVLLDTSASMKTIDGGADHTRARIDVAKDEAKKLVRGLGGSDRVLVATMDALVTPRTPMTGEIAQLEAAIDEVTAQDCRADFPRGLRFALDTLRGSNQAEIVVIGDRLPDDPHDGLGAVKLGDVKLSYVPIGSGKRNVAVSQFAVRRYPLDKGRYEVMIEVQNLGDKPEGVQLSLYGDDVLVDVTNLLNVKPGEARQRFYPSLGGASRTLEARISLLGATPSDPVVHDDLPADDRAFAVLPERRRSKILAVTAGNTYLDAALLLDEYLDVTTVTADRVEAAMAKERFDVAIYDGVTPPLRPGLPALYLDPRGSDGPLKLDPKQTLVEPSFDTLERKHPMLRWTALDTVGIAQAAKMTPGEGDKVVGASEKGPLIVAGQRAGTKFAVLGFDVRQSDFPLRIGWPVFLLNTINWFVEEDADYLSSFKTGEVWHVPAPLGAKDRVTLIDPDGKSHEVPVQEGRAVYFGTRAGFYRLRPPADARLTNPDGTSGGPPADTMFAANLVDPVESAIAPRAELKVDGKRGGAVEGFGAGIRRENWIYLLIAVVLVTAIEWATYHRRITV
jgi:hypothetical protein